MSLLKTKYNRSKARRIKLSNRNRIEHLHSQLKKFKAEKREMKAVKDKMKAEKDELVQQQLQDIGILTEELKSEKEKVHDHFSSGHVCFDIFNCDPKKAHRCVINSKNDSPATCQKSFPAGLDFYFDFGHGLNKKIVHYTINTHTLHVSFLF